MQTGTLDKLNNTSAAVTGANRARRNVRLVKSVSSVDAAYALLKGIRGRHFLTGAELSQAEILALLEVAQDMKADRKLGKLSKACEGKHLSLLFEKASLRTRYSFTIAMTELGGHVIEAESSQRKSEEPEDLVRVLGGYVHAVMLRTHGHDTLERMVKVSPIPVINGLSDSHHPCQALADLLTLKEKFKELKGLTLTYIGDGNNVLHSLLVLAPLVGVNVHFACPRGYGPDIAILEMAQKNSLIGGGVVRGFVDPMAAALGADALYTDVWTSMGFEDESQQREEAFRNYQVNAALFAQAKATAVVMHCLPMVRGKEITSEMADHAQSALFQQSENRLHAQKALLYGLIGG